MARDINDVIREVKAEGIKGLREVRADIRKNIRCVETNYLAAQLLAAEGFNLFLSDYSTCSTYAQLELKNPKDLAKVRKALGVKLTANGRKEPVYGKRTYVWVQVEAEGFPGLRIQYQQKLRKGAKCRIVTQRRKGSYRTVVCGI